MLLSYPHPCKTKRMIFAARPKGGPLWNNRNHEYARDTVGLLWLPRCWLGSCLCVWSLSSSNETSRRIVLNNYWEFGARTFMMPSKCDFRDSHESFSQISPWNMIFVICLICRAGDRVVFVSWQNASTVYTVGAFCQDFG